MSLLGLLMRLENWIEKVLPQICAQQDFDNWLQYVTCTYNFSSKEHCFLLCLLLSMHIAECIYLASVETWLCNMPDRQLTLAHSTVGSRQDIYTPVTSTLQRVKHRGWIVRQSFCRVWSALWGSDRQNKEKTTGMFNRWAGRAGHHFECVCMWSSRFVYILHSSDAIPQC